MRQMLTGSSEVYIAIFTFAGSAAIDDGMLAPARGGVKIKGCSISASAGSSGRHRARVPGVGWRGT